LENADIPEEFDSRVGYKECVHPIRDQQKCGSCWAFSASEALSDRFCIESNGAIDVILSPEELLECDTTDMGCNGGELKNVWNYLESQGTTTDECVPYISGTGTVPSCSAMKKKRCDAPDVSFLDYKCAKGSIVEALTAEQIKNNIFLHGPMQTGF